MGANGHGSFGTGATIDNVIGEPGFATSNTLTLAEDFSGDLSSLANAGNIITYSNYSSTVSAPGSA